MKRKKGTLKKDILKKIQAKDTQELEVPEWGETILINSLNTKQFLTLQSTISMIEEGEQDAASIIAAAILGTTSLDGEAIFEMSDFEELVAVDGRSILNVGGAVLLFNDLIPNPDSDPDELKKN